MECHTELPIETEKQNKIKNANAKLRKNPIYLVKRFKIQ